jgi:hypothetical protein
MTSQGYTVHLRDFATLQEIEGQWTPSDFAALLDEMEFGDHADLSDSDLRDMCLMSLQDLEPEEAAYIVLKHVVGEALREGQLRNAANEMRDEKLWEEYVDPAFHGRMFRAASLLFAAFPRIFPKTDAVQVTIEVKPANEQGRALLQPEPAPSILARLLAGGMDDHAVLNRFFGDQIKGKSFPNAADIIWMAQTESAGEDGCVVKIVSSGYWLDPLEDTESYDVQAHADT